MEEDILGELHDLSNHVLFVNERAIGKIASLQVDNERLRQQNAELLVEMNRIADVSERWEDSLVSQINEIARAAIAKAAGGE